MNKTSSLKLFPTFLNGKINTPPSKSLSHRALICAALSDGVSEISNIIYSDDINATINAIEIMGAKCTKYDNKVVVKGTKRVKLRNKVVDCNESGSTIRFMIPILSLSNKEIHFTGKKSLISRPQSIYKRIFEEDGNTFDIQEEKLVVKGSIKARDYFIEGNVSSQFFTGLLFSLPLLNQDSTLHIKGKLESESYINLTIDLLETFGITINKLEHGYHIPGNQQYKPTNYRVEGDYSQAAFFLVGGVINGGIKLEDLRHNSYQGDKEIIDIIKSMNGRIVFTENGFVAEESQTKAKTIDISNCPDLGPILALLGSLSKGVTKIINASRLRLKESDRIESTVNTLLALGATIKIENDDIIISGKKSLDGGVTLDSYNDHRIAMMIAIAATKCNNPVILTNSEAVKKSYPHFFEDYQLVGGKVEEV